jgi:retron-type reverse transcriptase
MMHGKGKSDRSIVPTKRPNKAATAAAEDAEGRDLTKGNVDEQNADRTQSRNKAAPSALDRVRERARRDKDATFTALLHHITIDRLREAYRRVHRNASPGVDGVTWEQYGEKLEDNLLALHARLHRGAYRAKPSRRTYIPKADGRQRPLGIATVEDKIVQRAVVEVMNAIYEEDFLGFSYGFRPGRSQHHALDALAAAIKTKKVNWVLDADLRGFFDAIDHGWLVKFVEHRIGDERVVRLIQKWLSAGVMENGRWSASEVGSPQGATVSPLLANIYLHYVLDLWVHQWRKRHARGDLVIVRYADDRAPRWRGKEIARSNGRGLAAQEMRAGPSGSGCRTRAQTTGCCSGPMTGVVSESEKAGPTRQVCAVKTNASEPLLTCRKRRDVHRNRAPVVGSGQMRGEPVDCSHGDRHEDGVSTAQALVWNVGTCRLDVKRALQAVDP